LKRNVERRLVVGDLVYHLLYGKNWVGLVMGFGTIQRMPENTGLRDVVQIRMQFGSEYEFFFKRASRKYRITNSLGYVSCHWLRLLEGRK